MRWLLRLEVVAIAADLAAEWPGLVSGTNGLLHSVVYIQYSFLSLLPLSLSSDGKADFEGEPAQSAAYPPLKVEGAFLYGLNGTNVLACVAQGRACSLVWVGCNTISMLIRRCAECKM